MFIFCNPTDNFDVGEDSWVFMLADFGEALCSLLLALLATYSGNLMEQTWPVSWRWQYIIFCEEYSHYTVNQMHEYVLNSVAKVTKGLRVFLAIPYIAI